MEQIRKIRTEQFFRELSLNREAVNVDERTVELAFSSEVPYERWYGMEILDHGAQSIRLGRLNDGAPLLVNHDADQQAGVVQDVTIGSDRVGRAVVRFGKSAFADEIFNDVVDGIRQKVSVGYMVHEMILDSKQGNVESYRVTDWEPFEVSIVSIPADNSVGVGRGLEKSIPEKEEKKMTIETPATPVAQAPAAPVDVRAIQEEANKKQLQRIADLEALGAQHAAFDGPALARKFIAEGKSVEELRVAILEKAGQIKAVNTAAGEIGMTEEEKNQYSFVRLLNALANPNDRQAQEAAKFELECSRRAVEKTGRAARGIVVPVDMLRQGLKRDLVAGTGSAGGHTVATNLLAGSFIELMRKKMVTQRLGATVLNGLTSNIAIPRHTGAATAYWVAESGAPTESQQTFDQVTMSPKTVGAYTDISRKLLLQSSLDVEALVRNDLASVLALEIDRAALYGSGSSNEPTGLKITSGLNTVDFTSTAPTYAEIVDMESQIAADNADVENMAYLVNARGRGLLKTTTKDSGSGQFLWEPGNTVNGYRAEVSNQVEGTASDTEDMWMGNWADLIIGFWSGLDLIVDPYSNSTSGTVRIVAMQDVDVAVRHAQSFCRGAKTL